MRVAYVCADPGVPVFGRKGCSIHVQEVLRALTARGLSVALFANRFDGDPAPDLQGVEIHALPAVRDKDIARRERQLLAANEALRQQLERLGSFDLVYERYSLWSFAAMQYAHATEAPGLLEVNAPLIEEQARHRGLVDRQGAEAVAGRVFSEASALIAVSDAVAAYLKPLASAQTRVHVIPNGVNPDRFPLGLAPSHPSESGTLTIGFVGTLKPWHGLFVLIEAFSRLIRLAKVRLLIVGDGPERQSVRADLQERGLLEATLLTGAVGPDEVPGLLASMDVAVAPYPRLPEFYFSPLKIYEYMAAGLPVVASRIGQVSQLIHDGINGLLCAPGDAAELAAALRRLCEQPELRLRLGQAARETVLQRHTWQAVVEKILHVADLKPCVSSRCLEGVN